MIILKSSYTAKHGGAYFAGNRAAFGDDEDRRLVNEGKAEWVTRAPVGRPANAKAATSAEKKRLMAAEIKRLGGTVPYHTSGLAKFEAALRQAQEG